MIFLVLAELPHMSVINHRSVLLMLAGPSYERGTHELTQLCLLRSRLRTGILCQLGGGKIVPTSWWEKLQGHIKGYRYRE